MDYCLVCSYDRRLLLRLPLLTAADVVAVDGAGDRCDVASYVGVAVERRREIVVTV